MKESKHIKYVLIVIGVILATVNYSGLRYYGSNIQENNQIADSGDFDFENYKVLSIIQPPEDLAFTSTVNWLDISEPAIIRNFPAYYHVYSLGGYNLSYNPLQSQTVNELLKMGGGMGEYEYANASNANEFILSDKAIDQLIKNSVRYIITNSNSIIEQFEKCKRLNIEEIVNINEEYNVIVLSNIPSIIHSNKDSVQFINENDSLIIEDIHGIKQINISFPYNSKLVATQYDIREIGEVCDIHMDENGFIVIYPNENTEKIIVHYNDIVSVLTIFFSIISSFIMLFLIFKKLFDKNLNA